MIRTIRRGATALLAAFALVGLTAVAALACHNVVTLTVGACDHTTGSYFVTATISNSEARDYEVLSAATIMQSGINGHQVADNAHPLVVTQEYAPGDVLTLTVTGTWPTRHVTSTATSNTVTVPAGDCSPPPPPPPPPPHHPCDACHMVHKATTAPAVTDCRGILVGGVYNDVKVRKDHDCTIVNGYVNGDVYGVGAHNLTLGNTDVRGSVYANDVTGTVTVGATNRTCAADPRIGGSLYAKGSHNVVLCNLAVCHAVVLKHDDGRLMVRDSTGATLRVQGNRTFVKDGHPRHKALAAIRLYHDRFARSVVKHNRPRPVLRR